MKTIPFMHRIAHGAQKKTLEIGQNLKRFDRPIKALEATKAFIWDAPFLKVLQLCYN
mgnify:CR=1 FL=1